MSRDEPAERGMNGTTLTKDACIAPALQICPDLIEKLPVGIYACDMQKRIVWFNARAAALWGRKPQTGDDIEGFRGVSRPGKQQIFREEKPMSTVLKTGMPIRGIEAMVERPDGSRIWTMTHIEPV